MSLQISDMCKKSGLILDGEGARKEKKCHKEAGGKRNRKQEEEKDVWARMIDLG